MAAFPARDREAFMEHWTTHVLGDDTATKRTIVVDEQVVGNIVSWMSDERAGRLLDRSRTLGEGHRQPRPVRCSSPTWTTRRPLHAHVARQNPASIRVLEKCGFRIVGEATIEESGAEIEEVVIRLDRRDDGPSGRSDLRGERPRRQAAEDEHHRLREHDDDRQPDPGEQELADRSNAPDGCGPRSVESATIVAARTTRVARNARGAHSPGCRAAITMTRIAG